MIVPVALLEVVEEPTLAVEECPPWSLTLS